MGDGVPDPRSGLDESGRWVPAFPGQRPPFPEQHGAYSSSLRLAPRATELAGELRVVVPGYSAADEPAVRLLALCLARVERATAALEKVDEAAEGRELSAYLGDGAESLRRLREDTRGWLNSARRLMGDLGMSPTSRARLGLDVARTRGALDEYLAEHYPAEGGS